MRDVTYHPILISDHSPVSFDLDFADLANLQRRNWRFDPTLLKDETFHKKLEKHILDFINDNDKGDVDDAILWESMKAVIRGHIILFSAAKRKSQETALKDLESNIQQLEQTYQSSPKIELLGEITKLKCEYNSLLSKQVCLQITKCKQTFFELGDKPHRLLARLLRKTQASQTILSINNKHGQTTRNPQEINKCFEDFYRNLYTSKSSASQSLIEDFLEKCNLPKLDDEAVADLETDFTLDEIKTAIQQMSNNKAPGPDGFGAEFYKA